MTLIAYKQQLKAHCIEILTQRVVTTRKAMDEAQAAANSEEKSSAGDKYETSRAISQRERDQYATQLAESVQELALLYGVEVDKCYEYATTGAVVRCGDQVFFIATGIGKITIGVDTVIVLSTRSPLAHALRDHQVGSEVVLNGKRYEVDEVY